MLLGVDPLLSPDLLHVLALMGHGDRIAIVDANYPAHAAGPRVITLPGLDATTVLRAVLSVLPLDTFVDDPAVTMAVVGDAAAVPEAVREFGAALAERGAAAPAMVERLRFYEIGRACFAVVQTGERRLYGNIILTKGVISPASRPS